MVSPPARARPSATRSAISSTTGGSSSSGSGSDSGSGSRSSDNSNKPDPGLAQSIHASLHTRTIPAPLPEGATDGMSAKARQAAEDEAAKEQCPVCFDPLPDTGRGIIPCGHVFCFGCIHLWTKTNPRCPTCRVGLNKITKTLTPADIAKEAARIERNENKKDPNKKQKARMKKNSKVKTPVPGVKTKVYHLRDKTKKKGVSTSTPQFMIRYLRRQEEQQQTQRQQAQARRVELAAEAQRFAVEQAERYRIARERLDRAKKEQAIRQHESEDTLEPLEAAGSAWADIVGAGGEVELDSAAPPSPPAPAAPPRSLIMLGAALRRAETVEEDRNEPSGGQREGERQATSRGRQAYLSNEAGQLARQRQQQQRDADRARRLSQAEENERDAMRDDMRDEMRDEMRERLGWLQPDESGEEDDEEEDEGGVGAPSVDLSAMRAHQRFSLPLEVS